jgi:hypothetical protein
MLAGMPKSSATQFTDNADSWMGLLDDASKAKVLEARIKADAETEQTRVREQEETKRTPMGDNLLYSKVWRTFFVCLAATIVLTAVIVAWNDVQARRAAVESLRIRTEHPEMREPSTVPVPVPSKAP